MDKENTPDTILSKRKSEHLNIVATRDVGHKHKTMLGDIQLIHQAIPELDQSDIDLSTEFFGKKLNAPLMITGMTGGAEYARRLNRGLAKVASQHGIALGVGSQRVMIHHPESAADFQVRSLMPDSVLLGNIGAVQLPEHSPDVIKGLMEQIEADGICVHLNAAQELMQQEGHRDFKGILEAIARLVDYLDGKVLVKETGAGMSVETLQQLKAIGVPYVDVSGAGGTSWTKVEAYRATDPSLRQLGEAFADWGVPTAFSLIVARRILDNNCFIIGSGGILSGLDAARAIVAGADIVGFARPALLAFLDNDVDGVSSLIDGYIKELRTAMLLTGAKNIPALKRVSRVYIGELRAWLESHDWLGGEEVEN